MASHRVPPSVLVPLLLGLPVCASLLLEPRQRLVACLEPSVSSLVLPGDGLFDDARRLINRRADIEARPLAVVRAKSTEEVQTAVACAAECGVQACARAGGHGFDGDAGCTDGLMIDVRGLQTFAVDGETQQTTFGAGHTLGQLYHKLDGHGLLVDGGAVSSVGAAGLVLGCGRGLTTQLHGLACDALRAVEYVDAAGQLRTADAATDPDVFWMARGSGGNFPGIVTKFTMQAFARPEEVYSLHCAWQKHHAKEAIKAWLARGEELVDPGRKVFTSLQIWNQPATTEIFMYCFDCSDEEKQWMTSALDFVKSSAPAGWCEAPKARTWLDQILYESGYYQGQFTLAPGVPKEDGLLDPANGWGMQGMYKASKNGGHMGNDWIVSDALIDDVLDLTHENGPKPEYGVMIEWYLTGGPKVQETPHLATPYGHRDANWVLHYKHQWAPSDTAMMETMMEHHHELATAIDRHLPCRNFYNYIDNAMPCAATNEAWLEAHFSDLPRMRAVKATADPFDVFRSRLVSAAGDDPGQPPAATPTPPPAELHFTKLSQGNCASVGLHPITHPALCEAAARSLQLPDKIAKLTHKVARPEGCYFFKGKLLYVGLSPQSAGRGAETSTPGLSREPICSSWPDDPKQQAAPAALTATAPSSRRRRRRSTGSLQAALSVA